EGSGTSSSLRPLASRYSVTPSMETVLVGPCATAAGTPAVRAAGAGAAGAATAGRSHASRAASEASFTNIGCIEGKGFRHPIVASRGGRSGLKFSPATLILPTARRIFYNLLHDPGVRFRRSTHDHDHREGDPRLSGRGEEAPQPHDPLL